MSAEKFTVHVINPKGKKKSAAKPKAKKKAGKKPVAKKKIGKKRVAKRRAPSTKAPAKRRRRRRNPLPATRKKRRGPPRTKNSAWGFGGLIGEAQKALPRVAGMLAVAWAVRKWGGTGSLMGSQVVTSEFAGTSWTMRQYGIALIVAQFGGKLLSKIIDPSGFRQGAMDAIVMKFVWTEGIAKSDWGKQQFGTGDIYNDTDTGQLYWDQNGRQVAMQGLVEAGAMDGLVEGGPMDGHDSGGYGHLMSTGSNAGELTGGAYHGSGYADPYHAAVAA